MRYLDDGTGDSAASIAYYREHRHRLGRLTEADVYFPGMGGPYPYCLIVRDLRGNEIWLSGCAAGYPGENARAAMEVLVDSGWSPGEARRVFTEARLELRKPEIETSRPRRRSARAPERCVAPAFDQPSEGLGR